MRALFDRVARARPTVVVVDDLQWSDEDGYRMLEEIVRPPRRPPLLFIALRRPWEESEPPLPFGWEGQEEGSDALLHLEGLTEAESAELVSRLLGAHHPEAAHLVERIVAEARGHPLFLHALERYVRDGASVGTLPDLDAAILAHVNAFLAEERRLIETVAVAGAPIAQDLAARAAGVEPHVALRRLKTLRLEKVVRTHGPAPGDWVEVAHDRIREAILKSMPPGIRARYHLGLAEALESRDHDPERTVRHWVEGGQWLRAAQAAGRAADRAEEALAFERAAALYRLTLSLDVAGPEEEQALKVRLGWALSNAGKAREAAAVFLEAADHAKGDDALALRVQSGTELVRTGHLEEGLRLLSELLRELGFTVPRGWAGALPRIAWHRLTAPFCRYDFEPRSEEEVPKEVLLSLDATHAVINGFGMIDPLRGLSLQRAQLRSALAAGEPFRVARALTLEVITMAVGGVRTKHRVQTMMAEAEGVLQDADDPRVDAMRAMMRGNAAFWIGDYPTTAAEAERAVRTIRERCVGCFTELGTMESQWIEALRMTGDWCRLAERAPHLIEEYRNRGDRIGESLWWCSAPNWAHLMADEPDTALEKGAEGIARFGGEAFSTVHFAHFYFPPFFHAYRGDPEAALDHVASRWEAFRKSLSARVQLLRVYGHEIRALAALHAASASPRQREEHAKMARASARALRREASPWAQALATVIDAQCARLRGDLTLARRRYTEAIERFDTEGLGPYREATRHRLGELLRGDEGRSERDRAEAYFVNARCLRPEAVIRMLVPV